MLQRADSLQIRDAFLSLWCHRKAVDLGLGDFRVAARMQIPAKDTAGAAPALGEA